MSDDPGVRLPNAPKPDFTLPRVLNIKMRATRVDAPQHRNFISALPTGNGVEFIVTTDGPIPGRALGPALYVGETAITEVTMIRSNTYRFVTVAIKALKRNSPIVLGWTGQRPAKLKRATFRYRP